MVSLTYYLSGFRTLKSTGKMNRGLRAVEVLSTAKSFVVINFYETFGGV